jgi:hypothetical protein
VQLDYEALQQAASAARAESKRKKTAAATTSTNTPAGASTSSPFHDSSSSSALEQDPSVTDVVIDLSAKSTLSCKSIFQLYSRQQRGLILAIVSLASVLVPLSDTGACCGD